MGSGKAAIILDAINQLLLENPSDKFILLTERQGYDLELAAQNKNTQLNPAATSTKNYTFITISKPKKESRINLFRFKLKVQHLIKNTQADVNMFMDPFFTFSGINQLLLFPDCSFFRSEKMMKDMRARLNKNAPLQPKKILQKIIVNSEYEKCLIADNKICPPEKIIIVKENIFKSWSPISLDMREKVKEIFSDGNEYFLYHGPIEKSPELMTTLRAFSAFKKRQLSGMQLVLTGNAGATKDEFMNSLQSYKFKDDVKVYSELNVADNDRILSSAYACILPFVYVASLQTFYFLAQAAVPIIAPAEGSFADKEVAHFKSENFQDMAIQMLHLFKDENKRKSIIDAAQRQNSNHKFISLSFLLKPTE